MLSAGHGELDFEKVNDRTILRTAYAKAPLRFLTPQNHGDAAWVYLTNYGGGLVDGDQIQLKLKLRARAQAVLLTQASSKVYRGTRGASQSLSAQVASEAALIILPDPLVCFAGAKFAQTQEIHLDENASLLIVDIVSSGRHASGERWLFDRLSNRIRIHRKTKPIFLESLLLDSRAGPIAERMGRFNAFCVVILIGPDFFEHGKAFVDSLKDLTIRTRADLILSGNIFGSDGAIIRVAAVSLEALGAALKQALNFLPEYLGDDPWTRKW